MADRIARIEIKGLRSIEQLTLDLDGLCVLIGEAGSGKSSVVEAFAILQGIEHPDFLRRLHSVHGGPHALVDLRSGGSLQLAVSLAGIDPENEGSGLKYALTLSGTAGAFSIESEMLWAEITSRTTTPMPILDRGGGTYRSLEPGVKPSGPRSVAADAVALRLHAAQGSAQAQRMLHALGRIEVHLPFDTTAAWAAREGSQRRVASRASQPLEPAHRLALFGENLSSAYHALKNDPGLTDWSEVIDILRLGLGTDVRDVVIKAESGAVQLYLKCGDLKPIPASALSDGMLSYLAFTALRFLRSERTLLVFDEPELHLHPHLLFRSLDLLREIATRHPVLITTHSDRLLDALEHPETETRLLELDERRSTRIRRPDAAALAKWLERYRGLGQLRQEGYEDAAFERPTGSDAPA